MTRKTPYVMREHTNHMARHPSQIYRLYGPDDELLYIGSSSRIDARVARHRAKSWGHLILRVDVDPDTLPYYEALWEERRQIQRLAPLHNVHYNGQRYPREATRWMGGRPTAPEIR